MKKFDTKYFAKEGEMGLNETSASHYCALASQIKDAAEKKLEDINFVNSEIDIVGTTSAPKPIKKGISSLADIDASLELISKMNSFISWFSEARKTLEDYKDSRRKITLKEYCEEQGISYPSREAIDNLVSPNEPEYLSNLTLEDIIKDMSVKDRLEYLSLEAVSAVYGKNIHPGRSYEKARRELHTIAVKEYETEGNGRDTIITHHTPSISIVDVDNKFIELQQKYREYEQKLNHMKSDLRNKLSLANTEIQNKNRVLENTYDLELSEYRTKYRELDQEYRAAVRSLTLDFNTWKINEETRLSKIKFVIPIGLAPIIDMLKSSKK